MRVLMAHEKLAEKKVNVDEDALRKELDLSNINQK
jgi:hypothetical protein